MKDYIRNITLVETTDGGGIHTHQVSAKRRNEIIHEFLEKGVESDIYGRHYLIDFYYLNDRNNVLYRSYMIVNMTVDRERKEITFKTADRAFKPEDTLVWNYSKTTLKI